MEVTREYLDELTKMYHQGKPMISDEEYDRLLEEYVSKHGEENRPFLRVKQSDDVNNIVGTLPKVFGVTTSIIPNRPVYADWLRRIDIACDKVIIQPKLDGVSVAYDVKQNRYFTRGDYDNGESVDVTELFKHRNLDKTFCQGQSAVKFEAIMSIENFTNSGLNQKYKRARDAVSATITSRNKEYADLITLFPLREYVDNKQQIPRMLMTNNTSMTFANDTVHIQSFVDTLLNNGAKLIVENCGTKMSYECDGVVVSKIIGYNNSNCIVSDNDNNGKEVAIKILNMRKQTRLINVDFQFGKSGRITPVAIVEPINFDNIIVDHITLSNIDRIVSMNLKYNDTVEVMYNIVPYLIDSLHDGDIPIQIPQICPMCGAKLDLSTLSIVRCTNPDCRGLKIGSIIRYCQKMKIMGVSEGILTKLYDESVISSISDLYKLTVDDIKHIDGFGVISGQNIVNSIKQSSNDVMMHTFLGAFPMDDVAEKSWMTIIMHLNTNDIVFNNFDELISILESNIQIKGIGDITRTRMINGLKRNLNQINKCLPYIKFIDYNKIINKSIGNKGVITFSGIRNKYLAEYLMNKGYEVNTTLTKNTKALVIPDSTFKSSKTTKASQINIPVYTIEEAYAVF